jgi:hypothetical protein
MCRFRKSGEFVDYLNVILAAQEGLCSMELDNMVDQRSHFGEERN